MAKKIKVALSPFYGNPKGFQDETSGILFTHSDRGEVQTYDITKVSALDGIKRAIRLNVLMLIEGDLDSTAEEVTVVEEPEVEILNEQSAKDIVVEEAKPKVTPKKK